MNLGDTFHLVYVTWLCVNTVLVVFLVFFGDGLPLASLGFLRKYTQHPAVSSAVTKTATKIMMATHFKLIV